jgi:cell division protease FtsH
VHKVTIIPRGRALGLTMQLPEQDRYAYDRDYLLARIAVLFGGRVAEELFMKQMTTGASATTSSAPPNGARHGHALRHERFAGPMVYAENEGEVFLGRSITKTVNMSEETMRIVDAEIRRIIDEQYHLARRLLEENRDKVESMAKTLLEWETIDADQILDIMEGRPPRPPKSPAPSTAAAARAHRVAASKRLRSLHEPRPPALGGRWMTAASALRGAMR